MRSICIKAIEAADLGKTGNPKDYPERTFDEMTGVLNSGQKCHIQGTVADMQYQDYSSTASIMTSNGICIGYYNFEKMPGEIAIGKSYDFYGTILDGIDDNVALNIDFCIENK